MPQKSKEKEHKNAISSPSPPSPPSSSSSSTPIAIRGNNCQEEAQTVSNPQNCDQVVGEGKKRCCEQSAVTRITLLVILVGLPASGKTSLAKHIKSKLSAGDDDDNNNNGCKSNKKDEQQLFQRVVTNNPRKEAEIGQRSKDINEHEDTTREDYSVITRCFKEVQVQHVCFDDITQNKIQEEIIIDSSSSSSSNTTRGSGPSSTTLDDGKWTPALWKQSRATALKQIDSLLKNGDGDRGDASLASTSSPVDLKRRHNLHHRRTSQQTLRLVIADDNMYFRSMRSNVVQIARRYGAGVAMLMLETEPHSCILRNQERPKYQRVSTNTIEKMANSLQPPDPKRFPWERNTRFIKVQPYPRRTDWNKVIDWKWLLTSWRHVPINVEKEEQNRVFQKAKGVEANEKSIAHQAEMKMRKCVGKYMHQMDKILTTKQVKNKKKELGTFSKKISQIRKNILRQLKRSSKQSRSISVNKEAEDSIAKLLTDYEDEIKRLIGSYDAIERE